MQWPGIRGTMSFSIMHVPVELDPDKAARWNVIIKFRGHIVSRLPFVGQEEAQKWIVDELRRLR